MSKMMKFSIFAVLFVFSAVAQAGVTLNVATHINSNGDTVYTLAAVSDGEPIKTLGIQVWSDDGSLRQVHPAGVSTHLQDYNAFFGSIPIDHDTQVLFATVADDLIVLTHISDTNSSLGAIFTGFETFTSRDIVQIVVAEGGHCDCEIGVVAGYIPGKVEYTIPCNIPEPASMGLFAVAGLALIRRR